MNEEEEREELIAFAKMLVIVFSLIVACFLIGAAAFIGGYS